MDHEHVGADDFSTVSSAAVERKALVSFPVFKPSDVAVSSVTPTVVSGFVTIGEETEQNDKSSW